MGPSPVTSNRRLPAVAGCVAGCGHPEWRNIPSVSKVEADGRRIGDTPLEPTAQEGTGDGQNGAAPRRQYLGKLRFAEHGCFVDLTSFP